MYKPQELGPYKVPDDLLDGCVEVFCHLHLTPGSFQKLQMSLVATTIR